MNYLYTFEELSLFIEIEKYSKYRFTSTEFLMLKGIDGSCYRILYLKV